MTPPNLPAEELTPPNAFLRPGSTVYAFVLIAAACTIALALGMPHTTVYGHDIFILLDGAWRVSQGQTPHVDFYSAHGPLNWLLWSTGLRLAGNRVEGLLYATALAGLLLGCWGFGVFRARFTPGMALLSLSFLLCFWLSPAPIGEPFYLPSFAMQYNKLGYVVFLILLAELFGTSAVDQSSGVDWGGISSGIALTCLLFLKPSFFFAGVALLAFAYVFRLKTLRHATSLVAGMVITAAAIFSYLGWHVGAYFHDLQIAARARPARFDLIKDVPRTFLRNIPVLVALSGMAILGSRYANRQSRSITRPVLLFLLLCLCDLVLAMTNLQRSGFPLTTFAVLLYGSQIYAARARDRSRWVLLLVLVTVLPTIGDTLNAWAVQVTTRKNTELDKAARVETPPLAALVFDDHNDPVWGQSEANGHLLTSRINEGIELLKQHSSPDESVFCLCYVNPFSYSLARPPAKGGSPFFDYSTNFTALESPAPEWILGNADLIIYPRRETSWATVGTLLHICGPLLAKNYHPLAESEQWIVLRRNTSH